MFNETHLNFPEPTPTTSTKQMGVSHPLPLLFLSLLLTLWTSVHTPASPLLPSKAAEVFLISSFHLLLYLFLPHPRLGQKPVDLKRQKFISNCCIKPYFNQTFFNLAEFMNFFLSYSSLSNSSIGAASLSSLSALLLRLS